MQHQLYLTFDAVCHDAMHCQANHKLACPFDESAHHITKDAQHAVHLPYGAKAVCTSVMNAVKALHCDID